MAEPVRRLFLALWPADADRHALAALAARIAGARRVRDDHLHLTLVFLGATSAVQQATYTAALADVSVPALELRLDRCGYWPQPRILWLGCSQTPPELLALVADVQQRLRGCGFSPERRAFQAHITLARQFPGPAPIQQLATPLHWSVRELVLVESLRQEGAACYQVLRRWPA